MNEHPREAYDHSWARCSGSAAGSFIIATTEFRFRHTPLPWVPICNAELDRLTSATFSTRRQGRFSTTETTSLRLVLTMGWGLLFSRSRPRRAGSWHQSRGSTQGCANVHPHSW